MYGRPRRGHKGGNKGKLEPDQDNRRHRRHRTEGEYHDGHRYAWFSAELPCYKSSAVSERPDRSIEMKNDRFNGVYNADMKYLER